MNPLYSSLVKSEIDGALSAAKSAGLIEHLGVRGRTREIFISRLLRPFLYPTMGICTGSIVDSFGGQSRQIDAIIFDRHILPPFMIEETGFVPIEAVVATVEVKSVLTKTEINKTIESANSIQSLTPRVPRDLQSMNFHMPASYLFAFKSDINGDELPRIKDSLSTIPRPTPTGGMTLIDSGQRVTTFCVAGKANYSFGKLNSTEEASWRSFPSDDKHLEIRMFLTSVINSIRLITESRVRPEFGTYIIE